MHIECTQTCYELDITRVQQNWKSQQDPKTIFLDTLLDPNQKLRRGTNALKTKERTSPEYSFLLY